MAYSLLNNVADGLTDVLVYCTPIVVVVFLISLVVRAHSRKRAAKQAADDAQIVSEAIGRADTLDHFWEQAMLPDAAAGVSKYKETYVRDMLSTIRRIRADLVPLLDQVQGGEPLDATQRKALGFARKELNRCMQRFDGEYFDVAFALNQMRAAGKEDEGKVARLLLPPAPLRRPASASFARTANPPSTTESVDDDWINPLNPLSPFSPLNPLNALTPLYSTDSWSGVQSEQRSQDDGERRYGSWSDSGGAVTSSVFSCTSSGSSGGSDGGSDDVSRRTSSDYYTPSDSGGKSDDGGSCGSSSSDAGGGGDGGGGGGGGGD